MMGGSVTPAYDRAGNMTESPRPPETWPGEGGRTLVYDAWNRLVKATTGSGESLSIVQEHQYDATNRRIRITTSAGVRDDYYSGQQVIAAYHYDGSSVFQSADVYVWSPRYIDSAILRDTYNSSGVLVAGDRVCYLADANYNVTGLLKQVSNVWQVAERYAYTPYGQVQYRDSDWIEYEVQDSVYSNTVLYTGRTLDTATDLYYYRARYYDAALERFISRDPMEAGLSLYEYGNDNPLNALMAFGEGDAQEPRKDSCDCAGGCHGRPSPHPIHPAQPKPRPQAGGSCGMEIGSQLDELSLNAHKAFFTLMAKDSAAALSACMGMSSTAWGWEINDLFANRKYDYSTRGCGTNKCRGTVMVHGQCHWASDVNYFLWGLANHLCASAIWRLGGKELYGSCWFTKDFVVDTLLWYRTFTFWAGDGTTAGRLAWARAGYDGNTHVPARGAAAQCGSCGKSATGHFTGRFGDSFFLGSVVYF